MAKRIQLSRKKGYRKPEGAIIVDRRSQWGNKHPVGRMCPLCRIVHEQQAAVAEYRRDLNDAKYADPAKFEAWIAPLRGHDPACWCPLPNPGEPDLCHAAVLLEFLRIDALTARLAGRRPVEFDAGDYGAPALDEGPD